MPGWGEVVPCARTEYQATLRHIHDKDKEWGSQQNNDRRTLMERSVPGRVGAALPAVDVPIQSLPDAAMLRDDLRLPELAEPEVVRYFTLLSHLNFSIDTNFYPLGSCTMKYNPKVNDEMAFLPGFAAVHPLQPSVTSPGRSEADEIPPGVPLRNHRYEGDQPGAAGRCSGRVLRHANDQGVSPGPGRDATYQGGDTR